MLWRLKCYEKSISNVIIITSIFTYIFTVRGEYIMIDLNSELMEQKMKVDFNTYDLSVKELLSMVNDGLINIAPEYQRQFRWDEERQSSLVESLFLGIPVPSLFMATNVDGTWEVIDGVQRLSTMICFAGDDSVREKVNAKKVEPLKLKGLSKLANFNDKRFSDLPVGVQNKFKLTSIKVTTLSDKSDKDPIVVIPNEIIPTDGKNLRYRQLESIAKTFGIHNAILPRAEIGGDIQEMVDKRNYIAHGNKTPKEVGREVSVNDLQRKLDHISEACTYIIELYEEYIEEQMYLKNH